MNPRPPGCLVGGYVDDATSNAELVHLVRIQLDLSKSSKMAPMNIPTAI